MSGAVQFSADSEASTLRDSARLVQVIEEGAWSEAVGSALSKLGVHVLDSQALPLRDLGSARELVHSASGLGVVSAVRAATAGERSRVRDTFRAANLSDEECAQLCSFLLQVCNTTGTHISPAWMYSHGRVQKGHITCL